MGAKFCLDIDYFHCVEVDFLLYDFYMLACLSSLALSVLRPACAAQAACPTYALFAAKFKISRRFTKAVYLYKCMTDHLASFTAIWA